MIEEQSIRTYHGIEVDYVSHIIAHDMVIRNGQWVCRPEYRDSSDKSVHGMIALMKRDPQKEQEMANLIIKNTYRTLMSTGMKECLVFNSNDKKSEWIKTLTKKNLFSRCRCFEKNDILIL